MAGGKMVLVSGSKKEAKDAIQDKKIRKLERRVAINKPELKYFKNSFGTPGTYTSLDNSNPLWLNLNSPIVVGSNEGQRIGHRFRNKFVEVRIQLGYVGGNQAQCSVRAMLYIDKNPRGQANPIFGGTTPWTDSVRDFQGDNQHNFKVLYDKTYDCSSQKYIINIVIKKKLNFISDSSRGNTGTYTDQDTGALYLLLFTNNQYTAGNAILYQGHYNLAYSDA